MKTFFPLCAWQTKCNARTQAIHTMTMCTGCTCAVIESTILLYIPISYCVPVSIIYITIYTCRYTLCCNQYNILFKSIEISVHNACDIGTGTLRFLYNEMALRIRKKKI